MMISRVELESKEAVVLHQHDYRNSSLIVHFFIKDYGKISAVARGVKQSKKNDYALLQPFQKIIVSLAGKNDLLNLKSIEQSSKSWSLTGKSLYCAYYLNELLLRLLPSHSDCQSIFELYFQILDLLDANVSQASLHYEASLRLFELKLLEFLGYGLNLSYEVDTGDSIETGKDYYYCIHSGPSLSVPDHGQYLSISGQTLNELANCKLCKQKTLQESKQLLKWALAEQLGDKPLKSREMFKQLYCQ